MASGCESIAAGLTTEATGASAPSRVARTGIDARPVVDSTASMCSVNALPSEGAAAALPGSHIGWPGLTSVRPCRVRTVAQVSGLPARMARETAERTRATRPGAGADAARGTGAAPTDGEDTAVRRPGAALAGGSEAAAGEAAGPSAKTTSTRVFPARRV
jgi:hypothetical protein